MSSLSPHSNQGRGATELDALEGAVTNNGQSSYVVGSLQLSPGIPPYFRPPLFDYPTAKGKGQWYTGLKFGLTGKPNDGWYGPPWGSTCPTGCPDALSGGITERDDLDMRYWTYKMEWKLGVDGRLGWYYDGEFIWAIDASAFGEYKVCADQPNGEQVCRRTPKRQMPQEPMSLVMNTAIGTWNGGTNALDGKHWPASFYIDYVRVWQDEINVGCDPPNYPTKKYIDRHAEWYGDPVTPLGTDTCPESYPDSARDHARELIANAAQRDSPGSPGSPSAAELAATPLVSLAAAQLAVQPVVQPVVQPAALQPAARWWQQSARPNPAQPGAQPQPQPQLAARANEPAAPAASTTWPLLGMAGVALTLALVATVVVLPRRQYRGLVVEEDEGEYQLAE